MLKSLLGRSLFFAVALAPGAFAEEGAVYTLTNAAGANAVLAYDRSADGRLGQARTFPTGGTGSGAGLGSQGAIALSEDHHWLLAVNAGSDDVTVFSVDGDALTFRSRTASGGTRPISVTLHGDSAFVLNAGGAANVQGFQLTPAGALLPLSGAHALLSGSAPAQVSFNDRGTALVVTGKDSNTLEVFLMDGGQIGGHTVTASAGATPFGFGFAHRDRVIVSEAFGGAPNLSAVSSYELDRDGRLTLITASLGTTQTAACWIAVTRDGRFAFAANTGSSSISSYAIGERGDLTLLQGAAGQTPPGTAAIDLAVSGNGRFLYALASGTLSAFSVGADGNLTPISTSFGLPPSTVGLAAR